MLGFLGFCWDLKLWEELLSQCGDGNLLWSCSIPKIPPTALPGSAALRIPQQRFEASIGALGFGMSRRSFGAPGWRICSQTTFYKTSGWLFSQGNDKKCPCWRSEEVRGDEFPLHEPGAPPPSLDSLVPASPRVHGGAGAVLRFLFPLALPLNGWIFKFFLEFPKLWNIIDFPELFCKTQGPEFTENRRTPFKKRGKIAVKWTPRISIRNSSPGNQDEIKTQPSPCARSWPSQCCKNPHFGTLGKASKALFKSLKPFCKNLFYFPEWVLQCEQFFWEFQGIPEGSDVSLVFVPQVGQGVPEWREQRPGCPGGIFVLCPVCSHVSGTFLGFPARKFMDIWEYSFIPKGFRLPRAVVESQFLQLFQKCLGAWKCLVVLVFPSLNNSMVLWGWEQRKSWCESGIISSQHPKNNQKNPQQTYI